MTTNAKINVASLAVGVGLGALGWLAFGPTSDILDQPLVLALTAPWYWGMTFGVMMAGRNEYIAFGFGIAGAAVVWGLLVRAILRRAMVAESTKREFWAAVAASTFLWLLGLGSWFMWLGFHVD